MKKRYFLEKIVSLGLMVRNYGKLLLTTDQINNQSPSNKGKDCADNNQKIHNSTFLSNKNINKNNNNRCQDRAPSGGRNQVHYLAPLSKYNEKIIKNPVQETAINPDFITSKKTLPVINGAIIPAASQATPRLAQNSANNLRCYLDNFFININSSTDNGNNVNPSTPQWQALGHVILNLLRVDAEQHAPLIFVQLSWTDYPSPMLNIGACRRSVNPSGEEEDYPNHQWPSTSKMGGNEK